MDIATKPFGTAHLLDGSSAEVTHMTLSNSSGMRVELVDYGATVTGVLIPRVEGGWMNTTVCPQTLEGLQTESAYQGATVGRIGQPLARWVVCLGQTRVDSDICCRQRGFGRSATVLGLTRRRGRLSWVCSCCGHVFADG